MLHKSIPWLILPALVNGATAPLAPAQCDLTELQKLLASDGEPGDSFGSSVSISGDTLFVGASGDDDLGEQSGSVYVFERIGGVWVEAAKLAHSDAGRLDWFGVSVSIDGDTAIVGAHEGGCCGAAYIFERIGGVWSETAKLTASDHAIGDYFGWSVSISGDAVVIGAKGNDDLGPGSGSAYVFERVGGVWTQKAKLLASDGAEMDVFGRSVAISGNTVIIGAIRDDNNADDSGSAYVFEKIGGAWVEVAKLLPSDGAADGRFGMSVSISGDTLSVGGSFSGGAYIFEKVGGVWTEIAKPVSCGGDSGSWVNVDGDTAVFTGCTPSKAFKRAGGVWSEYATLHASDSNAISGNASIDGSAVAVGYPSDSDNGQSSGSVYVFDLGCICAADFNGDGVVDTRDFVAFLNAWAAGEPSSDMDGNGVFDTRDFIAYLNLWAAGC